MSELAPQNQPTVDTLLPLTQEEFDSMPAPSATDDRVESLDLKPEYTSAPFISHRRITELDKRALWGSDYSKFKKKGSLGTVARGITEKDKQQLWGTDYQKTETSPKLERVPKQRLHKLGKKLLDYSAYTIQALHMGKEQVKSYGYGAAAVASSSVSKYSEILAPKAEETAYRRGAENRWRKMSQTALRATSRGLVKLTPVAEEFSQKSLQKYEDSYNDSEYNQGGGRIVRAARRRTDHIKKENDLTANKSDDKKSKDKKVVTGNTAVIT